MLRKFNHVIVYGLLLELTKKTITSDKQIFLCHAVRYCESQYIASASANCW